MIFSWSLVLFQCVVAALCLRTWLRYFAGEIPGRVAANATLPLFGCLVLLLAPVIVEIAVVANFRLGGGVMPGRDYFALYGLGLGSVATVLVFGRRLYRQHGWHGAGFMAVGANVAGLLVGIYMAVVVVDQVQFYFPEGKGAGSTSLEGFREIGQVNDLECDSSVLVVSGLGSDVVTYRCPKSELEIFGRYSGTPLVPWPGYIEGSSRDMAVVYKELMKQAQGVK